MNKKRTNRIVAIFNIIFIVAFYIFNYSIKDIISSVMPEENAVWSMYNSFMIDTLVNNIQIIMLLMYNGIGIINIICAIQNKKNKKICFWQLVYGIFYFFIGISLVVSNVIGMGEDVLDWIDILLYNIVPIILAIINLVLIKKHKPKVIQVISYIAIIILSILNLLKIIGEYWQIIAVIMQLIYIHFQDNDIEESKSRKIANIILYYILQPILAVGVLVMVSSSLLITKVNDIKWEKGLTELYNNVTTLKGSANKDIYIPVEKNYKYGFINENGQEKISCQYDRVTYFNEVEIHNSTYYIALAKKDNKFYIISKSNDSIELNGDLEKYMQTIENHWGEAMIRDFNKDGDYRQGYIHSFEMFLQTVTKGEGYLTQQTAETEDPHITLTEENSKYYYSNKNYSMIIDPIYDKNDEISSPDRKYNVTIIKSNGEQTSSIVYLPGLIEDNATLYAPGLIEDNATLHVFTSGYIEFENEEHTRKGWYDSNGDQITVSNTYIIRDIKDNKVILQLDTTEYENYDGNKKYEFHFLIIDMTGKTLLQSTAIDVYDNMYLVKNDNNKMVLMDKDLNVISNEYDRIITAVQADMSPNYSSYY